MNDPQSSNEIVEELRHTYPASGGPCLELTAADEIERLTELCANEEAENNARFDLMKQKDAALIQPESESAPLVNAEHIRLAMHGDDFEER